MTDTAKMTVEQAIRLLDPKTTVEAIAEIEYYNGFSGRAAAVQAVSDASELACEIMREYERCDVAMKWISVEERLPDKMATVLFATRNNPAVYRGRYIATGDKQAHYFTTRIGRANSGGTYAATHWMPLPELPEEVRQ